MAMRTTNSFIGTPEAFDAANDDWNDYVKRFKHFSSKWSDRRLTEVALIFDINGSVYIQIVVKPYRATRAR